MVINMKAEIDQNGCIACEVCVGHCPAVFRMSEAGPAEVIGDEIPKDEEDAAMDAAEACPVDVITIK